MVTRPEDKSILHEIVRTIEARRRVPERIRVDASEYLITYLEDHRNRLEEALRRYDSDRLNMLFGQLASKIKYQFNKSVTPRSELKRPPKPRSAESAGGRSAKAAAAKKSAAKKVGTKKVSTKKTVSKATAKKSPTKKTAGKKAAPTKTLAKKHK